MTYIKYEFYELLKLNHYSSHTRRVRWFLLYKAYIYALALSCNNVIVETMKHISVYAYCAVRLVKKKMSK